MTKLIITPIDMTAPGSHKARKRLLRAANRVKTVEEDQALTALLASWEELEALMLPHLATDDDTPVSEALDDIAAADFDKLIAGLMGRSDEAIPPETSAA